MGKTTLSIKVSKKNSVILAFFLTLFSVGCAKTKITEILPATGGGGGGGGLVLTSGVNLKKLAVGELKGFALTTSNVAQAWGDNYENNNGSFAQLGLGIVGAGTRTSPQTLDAATTYISLTSGETGSCGLTNTNKVKCWGVYNGDGTGTEAVSPVLINDGGSATYIDVDFGAYHGCAVQTSGVVTCWGDGYDGKLGNGDGSGGQQDSPVVADAGTNYVRVSAGRNHTCGITTAGLMRCWGDNGSGQIGDGTTATPRLAAITVDGTNTYSFVSVGDDSNCAITTAGVLKCWGDNGYGQLGDNSNVSKSSPTIIDTGTTYSKVSVGGVYYMHTCAVTTSGVLKCWGDNGSGQLGNGSTTSSSVPIIIDSGVSYKDVSVNFDHSCGVTTAGVLKCWGSNGSGQLGLGNTTSQNVPTAVGSGY